MEAYNSTQQWKNYAYTILYIQRPRSLAAKYSKICINRGSVEIPALLNVNETEVLGCQKSVQ